ncbi:O-antigen translocase [Neobacillus sp.]|uniref:O-antigen translocase n=1 Tax=Neobacillus sp. TaxID=2675273 RepID=UPI002896FCEE|nr:O-antigen translocase [Neobacillus sp.]
MNLIKTSILSSIATMIRIITGFVVNKVIALYVGPAGIAQIGQLQNFFSIISNLSNGAINQGVTKFTSFYSDDTKKQKIYINAAFTIAFWASLLTGILVVVFNKSLSIMLLNDASFSKLFISIGVLIIFYSINSILLAIVNGMKNIRKFTIINVLSSLFSLGISLLLTIKWGLNGALYSFVISQTLIIFITISLIFKESWFRELRLMKIERDTIKSYSKYTIMALVHVVTAPVSYIIVRNYITDTLSMRDAGYWQSIGKISDTYLMLITMTLSIYYLPRLSEIKDDFLLRKEILSGYKIIIPVLTVMLILIYFLKDFIIIILYSNEFLEMKQLFLFQLIGDFFKIASWLISFNMVVKEMTKHVIMTELFYSFTFTTLSIVFIKYFGLIGVTYSYSITYILYFFMVAFILRRILFMKTNK